MIVVCITTIIIAMIVVIFLALLEKSLADILQALNVLGTLVILFICTYGFLMERPVFLDLAIIYSLLNIVGTFAIYKYITYGDIGGDNDLDSSKD